MKEKIKHYFNYIQNIFIELKTSNNIIYDIIKYKNMLSGAFAFIAVVLGVIGFMIEGIHPFGAFQKTFGMFGLNYTDGDNFESNPLIFISSICAIISVFMLAVVFFIKDFLESQYIKKIISNKYTVVFGLGEINRSYLNSLCGNEKISTTLIVESDSTSRYIEEYREKGFGVLIGDALSDTVQAKLNYTNVQNAIVAMGDDRHNIEFAKHIMDKYDAENDIKLIIHIENKDLEILFYTNFIVDNAKKINIKTFSFFDEVAKNLFFKYSVDGDSQEYVNTNKEFKTIVLGDGLLIEKVLQQIALISHLPNENTHKIYLVDKNAKNTFLKVKKALYYKKENYPSLDIVPLSLDQNYLEFYGDDVWHDENLVNVVVAFDDEKRNLNTAVELYNRVYLQKAIDKKKMPKVIFGVYDELLLSKIVNENKEEFTNFYTYGNVSEILGYEALIEENIDKIAKLIHNGYGHEFDKKTMSQSKEIIEKNWYKKSKYSDKLSSIAQAKHIDIKLKSLGLKKIKIEDLDKKILLEKNLKIVYAKLIPDMKLINLDEKALKVYSQELEKIWSGKEYEVKYFPKEFDNLFEKMIRMEHNRWNAYQYINGWKYSTQKNKNKKEHDCLLPLKDFNKDSIKITVIYDIYSFLYLPNYLAESGYVIKEFVEKK